MIKIAIDFDSVLFPTLNNVIEVYNRKHNSNFDLSQITTYDLYECLGQDVADELIALFCNREVYDNLQPYKGATRAVKTLIEQGNEIYIATATDVKNLEWKERLLQQYFPFVPKNNLIRIHNKSLLNVDIIIEDNIQNLIRTFADRICFDQPWNRNEVTDYIYSIHRAYCWDDIINIINDIEKENKEWEMK